MSLGADPKRGLLARLVNRILHSHFILTRGLTIGVRAVVRSAEGKFLLVRHTYTPGWHFPGGGVEKNESTEKALINELGQETGLRLTGRPRLHGVFYNNAVSKRDHVVVYICDVEGELRTARQSLEIAEIGFFSLAEVPAGTDPGTVRRLREIALGQEISETW